MNIRLHPLIKSIQYRSIITHASTILGKTAVNLSFKIVGVGTDTPETPPIFILHGLLERKKHWKSIGKTIAHITKQTVIMADVRNHGASGHTSSNKYDDMATDLLQLFDKLHVDKASVVGYDIGGRMAMSASLIAPKRVAKLLVADISPISTSDDMKGMITTFKAMKAVDFKNPKKITHAKKEAKRQLKEQIKDDVIMFRVLDNIRVKKDGIIGWRCNLDSFIKNFNHFLEFPISLKGKRYDGPCLFLGGQLSEYIPADDLTKIREMFPQVVVRYIKKTGHNLYLEDPRSFLEFTLGFLDTNDDF